MGWPLLISLTKTENCLCFYGRLTSGLTRPIQWEEMSIELSGDFHQVFISLSTSTFVRKGSALISYVNADHCWMSSESNCFPSTVIYFSDDVGDTKSALSETLHFRDMWLKEKVNINIRDGRNLFEILGLNRHHEFQKGDIYVRQSKTEQWLSLISVLMNANWHICYGGLAVQTLQLVWLINYPHASGSPEVEAWERFRCGGWDKDKQT